MNEDLFSEVSPIISSFSNSQEDSPRKLQDEKNLEKHCHPSLPKLSERQEQVLAIVKEALSQGFPFPSLSQIAKKMNIKTKAGVAGHMKALEKKGYIQRKEQRVSIFNLHSENEENLEREKEASGIALVGCIAAGPARESFDDNEKHYIDLDPGFFGEKKDALFAVEVTGESMNGDAICEGDIAIIKKQKEFRNNNDILALRLHSNEVTLKRIQVKEKVIELISSNKEFLTKSFPKNSVEIIGKFVGLLRKA